MDEIEAYIRQFPEEVRVILNRIRALILEEAPDATESIAYGMPGYKTHKKPLVYFAGYQGHVGLYATPSGHRHFREKLAPYKQGKGSVQFPLSQPIPYDLIRDVVRFRVSENAEAAKS